ncbi:MAG: hypothetical protein ACP5NU_00815 [Methanomicrobiales archaeon]|jgi:hypothetical protein|nr:hypothetical protein [Methanomicrobiales archaeon]HMZ30879.1 hypothetical protein [Methanoregulaceae archaeon]HNJ80048.1 hypothetical protein [Methanoregulaceae archaeon]HNL85530.1 hypothetical protein [Methanoregulaceae archaeon]HNO08716.1 hypothetical protein [Methanoregulaceae archaeon]
MKHYGFLVVAFAMLVAMTGFAMADPGVNATFETQGITIVTSIQAQGNMDSMTDIDWVQTSADPITEVPSLDAGTYYASTYQEDTQSNGVGNIYYDKTTLVETKARLSNQWNIEAEKQINFVGIDGARISSDESIFVDGTGRAQETKDKVICVFAPTVSSNIPAFCNVVDTGSSIDMSVANVGTTTGNRFIVASADTPVEEYHTIRVDMLGDSPSIGQASAYMKGLIMEGRGGDEKMYEKVEFEERTSVDGYIMLFDKNMDWISGVKRA